MLPSAIECDIRIPFQTLTSKSVHFPTSYVKHYFSSPLILCFYCINSEYRKNYQSMSVIRVGLVGLSTSKDFSNTGAWASSAHLPFLIASPHYEVVALLNSSVQSAEASIAFHKLGPDVKAYGSPEDLAKDGNVDLVVVSVMVGKHYALAKPALLAGKNLLVEWPLGANLREVEELTELARSKDVKTIVGLQARPSVVVQKIKEVLDSGKIGKILSTNVVASFQGFGIRTWPADADYCLDENSGGNSLTISFAHCEHSILTVLSASRKLLIQSSNHRLLQPPLR